MRSEALRIVRVAGCAWRRHILWRRTGAVSGVSRHVDTVTVTVSSK